MNAKSADRAHGALYEAFTNKSKSIKSKQIFVGLERQTDFLRKRRPRKTKLKHK